MYYDDSREVLIKVDIFLNYASKNFGKMPMIRKKEEYVKFSLLLKLSILSLFFFKL